MGLPLFVAPVESDIPSNSAEKSAAVHHSRSSIHRSRRTDERENRALRRRHAAIRDNFPTPGPGASDQLSRPPRYPWIESGHPPPPEAYIPSASDAQSSRHRPLRDALREMASRGNMINEERLVSLFGERWVEHMRSSNSPPPPAPLDFVSPEVGDVDGPLPRSLSRHAQSRNLDDAGTDSRRRRHRIADQVAARFDRSPGLPDVPPAPPANTRGYLMRARRRALPVDGLGDRERSLSPEGDGVWDTLLSTLTPDPQPPSVGSSFASASASASAAASQSAAASSGTSLTGPEMADESTIEQPCESGCENSDSEDPDDLSLGTPHWSMNYHPSRYRRFVRDLDTIDPGTVSFVRGAVNPADIHRRHQAQRLLALRERVRELEDARRDMSEDMPAEMRARRVPRPLGQQHRMHYAVTTARSPRDSPPSDGLPRGNSEERRLAMTQSDLDADSVPGPQHGHDDAWDGMQRIFRNLSRREDIPDEWWAGAGLSRTLPDDA